MKRSFRVGFATLFLASAALAQGDAGAGSVSANGAADFSARLDALWVTRDTPESIKQQNQAVTEGLAAWPVDYPLLWRCARHKWYLADGQDSDHGAQKKALGKDAWEYADRALKAKPGGFEANYYKALSIGAYSEAVGILTALSQGLERQFVESLDLAMKVNEAYERAGPVRAKGRYYAQLPWPKRDREKAVELLNKAIKLSPEATRSYFYLAEVLLQAGKAKEAQVAMKKVFSLSPDFDPPEGRRILLWAKPVAEQIDAELK